MPDHNIPPSGAENIIKCLRRQVSKFSERVSETETTTAAYSHMAKIHTSLILRLITSATSQFSVSDIIL